ncbi:protein phosphatase 1 inhibitor potentiated by protein kinase C [Clonorchis sinensis]|uniref:Protein phosphatase 1 inhibitor potentiated by protein kinase C n=1 Tax=Clonorchis sinensis TaxID=79923 RepID=G7Y6L0_CLOSI|nr:protein phosphatase 1 inhibitor potentiated by protein kinase C [Clonorchis sinensis]
MKFVCLRQIFFITDCKVVRDYEDPPTGMDEQIKREKKSVTSDDKMENKGVAFSGDEVTEKGKRKRYLTAKYDKKTRIVVNKKIQLENFISEHLRTLYKTEVSVENCLHKCEAR